MLLAVVGAACGDSDDDGAPTTSAPATTTTEAPTTTTVAPTTTRPPGLDCPRLRRGIPAGAVGESRARGDFDGNGTPDRLTVYGTGDASQPGPWHVLLDAGEGLTFTADPLIEDQTAGASAIGGFDIDGDRLDEAFVKVGQGASAAVVGLFTIVDCTLREVTLAGVGPAQFPVGASVGNQSGLACRGDALHVLSGQSDDGTTIHWTDQAYTLDGASLVAGATTSGTYRSPADDDEIRALGSLACGPLDVT